MVDIPDKKEDAVEQFVADYTNQTSVAIDCGLNCSEVNKLLVQQESAEVSSECSSNHFESDLEYTSKFLNDANHTGPKQKCHSKSSPEISHKRIKVVSDVVCPNATESPKETAWRNSESVKCEIAEEIVEVFSSDDDCDDDDCDDDDYCDDDDDEHILTPEEYDKELKKAEDAFNEVFKRFHWRSKNAPPVNKKDDIEILIDFLRKINDHLKEIPDTDFSSFRFLNNRKTHSFTAKISYILKLISCIGEGCLNFSDKQKEEIGTLLVKVIAPIEFFVKQSTIYYLKRDDPMFLKHKSALEYLITYYTEFLAEDKSSCKLMIDSFTETITVIEEINSMQ